MSDLTIEALDNPEKSKGNRVFRPFEIACESGNPDTMIIAIDCLGKLFTYNYWTFVQASTNVEELANENDGTSETIAFVINTICDSFQGEGTHERVELQIIKVDVV